MTSLLALPSLPSPMPLMPQIQALPLTTAPAPVLLSPLRRVAQTGSNGWGRLRRWATWLFAGLAWAGILTLASADAQTLAAQTDGAAQGDTTAASASDAQTEAARAADAAFEADAAPPRSASGLAFGDIALDGELRFLAQRPDPDAYAYDAQLHIDTDSLRTGVVRLRTCHRQLDPNARVVVAFNAQRILGLEVEHTEGIQSTEVVGHQVELRGVQRGAVACISVRSRVLEAVAPNRWRLHAGPLMRRYLDGYLPMQAELSFAWPPGLLQLVASTPEVQPGVVIEHGPAGARMDLTFAGRMRATLELQRP